MILPNAERREVSDEGAAWWVDSIDLSAARARGFMQQSFVKLPPPARPTPLENTAVYEVRIVVDELARLRIEFKQYAEEHTEVACIEPT